METDKKLAQVSCYWYRMKCGCGIAWIVSEWNKEQSSNSNELLKTSIEAQRGSGGVEMISCGYF
jgi:hypothetical protein